MSEPLPPIPQMTKVTNRGGDFNTKFLWLAVVQKKIEATKKNAFQFLMVQKYCTIRINITEFSGI